MGRSGHLQTAGVDDFVADGALHQREAELLICRLYRVLLSRLATCKTHGGVRQHGLQGHKGQVSQVDRSNNKTEVFCGVRCDHPGNVWVDLTEGWMCSLSAVLNSKVTPLYRVPSTSCFMVFLRQTE